MLKQHGVRLSMDGKGRWRDNVFIEQLWRSVKYEEVYLHAYDTNGKRARLVRMVMFVWVLEATSSPSSRSKEIGIGELFTGCGLQQRLDAVAAVDQPQPWRLFLQSLKLHSWRHLRMGLRTGKVLIHARIAHLDLHQALIAQRDLNARARMPAPCETRHYARSMLRHGSTAGIVP